MSKEWYALLNLSVCIKGQADRLGIEHEGVPTEGVVVRLAEATIEARGALESLRALHRRFTYYELEDSCPDTSEAHREEHHHESEDIGEFYCDQLPTGDVCCASCVTADGERLEWPCPTIRAIETKETRA